jgi:EmrB/QacA subfamily drug resistance transporter
MTAHANRALVLALCCLAQFMVVLDLSIVNVALPSIQRDLDMGTQSLQWIVIAYGLLLGGFLLLGGRMGDLLGRRRIFLLGAVLFSLSSLVAGLANSTEMLIGARAAQGFGAALLAPSALSILAATFAEGKARNQALGIYGAVGGSSASVGVIASGLLTDGPGWRWVFFINVPVGILLVAVALRYLRNDPGEQGRHHYDAAGATTVTAALLLGIYGLNRAADHGWTDRSNLILFGAAILLMAAFVGIERRSRSPLIPGAILRNRTMIAANVASFLLYGGFFAFIFLGSLLMQQTLGYSPTRTGVAWLATSVMAFVASAVAGARLMGLVGIRPVIVTGMTLLVLAAAWLARLPADAGYLADVFPAFLLGGIAIGLAAPAVGVGALDGAGESTMGLASGLVETMREVGGVVAIAAVTTVLIARGNDAAAPADPLAREAALVDAFGAAFVIVAVLAGLGMVGAAVLLPRRPVTLAASAAVLPESAD